MTQEIHTLVLSLYMWSFILDRKRGLISVQCSIKTPQHPALLSSWHSLKLSYCILSCIIWVLIFWLIIQHVYMNLSSMRAGLGCFVLTILRRVFNILLQVFQWMNKLNESVEWINERLCFQLCATDWKASGFHQHKHSPCSLAEITIHFILLLVVA